MIIQSCTVAIISKGTPHPLDPPHYCIHLLKTCGHRPVSWFSRSRGDTKAHTHAVAFKQDLCSESSAEGWGPKDVQRSNNNPAAAVTEWKGKDQEDESKTIYALWSHMNGLTSQWKERKSMQNYKKRKNWEAEKGLRPSRGREIEFHIGK